VGRSCGTARSAVDGYGGDGGAPGARPRPVPPVYLLVRDSHRAPVWAGIPSRAPSHRAETRWEKDSPTPCVRERILARAARHTRNAGKLKAKTLAPVRFRQATGRAVALAEPRAARVPFPDAGQLPLFADASPLVLTDRHRGDRRGRGDSDADQSVLRVVRVLCGGNSRFRAPGSAFARGFMSRRSDDCYTSCFDVFGF